MPFTHLRHAQNAANAARGAMSGYYALAQHFGWALAQLFVERGHPRVIILEDDLAIAGDFFDYFSAVEPLLDEDASLLAASAWNDLGQEAFIDAAAPAAVHRSDFFGGLGWMMSRHVWEELGPKWPDSFWDDWLREPAQRRGRAFLRPGISRSATFGVQGVSHAQFFEQYLGSVVLSSAAVDWAREDLRYLDKVSRRGGAPPAAAAAAFRQLLPRPPLPPPPFLHPQPTYDAALARDVAAARVVPYDSLATARCSEPGEALRTNYRGLDVTGGYAPLARAFGFIDDAKAGVPRMAYRGVTAVVHNGCRKFLVDAELEGILDRP